MAIATIFVTSSYGEGEASKSAASYRKNIAKINENYARIQAEQVIKAGEKTATNYNRQIKQMIGTQRSSFASQGVDVNEGTAAEIQLETADFGAEDAQTIRSNAFLQAWGFKTQARNDTRDAEFNQRTTARNATRSLVNSGMKAWAYGQTNAGRVESTPQSGSQYGGPTGSFLTPGP